MFVYILPTLITGLALTELLRRLRRIEKEKVRVPAHAKSRGANRGH